MSRILLPQESLTPSALPAYRQAGALRLNEQVKRNRGRFPEYFMSQLTILRTA